MIRTAEFDYDLPEEKIARFPPAARGQSKLLCYHSGKIEHRKFPEITHGGLLPEHSLLVFNNSKVIPARIIFKNATGASIELFLLEPYHTDHLTALSAKSSSTWSCMVGNRKRWKKGQLLLLDINNIRLTAAWEYHESNIVRFTWTNDIPFAKVLESLGEVPLPPYLNRDATPEDHSRYQTVYATTEGAVAAPTAGLHFTDEILGELERKNFKLENMTLHVGAGTFLPVKDEDAQNHKMHEEVFICSRQNLENLANHTGPVIPVGTTSMRMLESLYWIGIKTIKGLGDTYNLDQNFPYEYDGHLLKAREVFEALAKQFPNGLQCTTSIFIRPGYNFRVCNGLITNFHQPKSTLLMLIAALVGPHWKSIYREALENDYRFLSYGDSSLLIP